MVRLGMLVHPAITCGVDSRIGEVRRLLDDGGRLIVVSDGGVVLGTVSQADLGDDDGTAVGDVMHPGPSTYRAGAAATELAKHLERHQGPDIIVTTPDGVLVGLVKRARLREALPE